MSYYHRLAIPVYVKHSDITRRISAESDMTNVQHVLSTNRPARYYSA